jgi:HD-like signal output (HDOD) protein
MIARLSHRVRQFFGALRPRVTSVERAHAYAYLSPAEQKLFETMTLRDQQHGIIVMRRVARTAGDDRLLLTAALLHDCGKGDVSLWHRIIHVAAGGIPAIYGRLASEGGHEWRRALWRLHHHAALGADLAAQAGADADVVRMIREQDAPAPDARLALLQMADNA